MGGGHDPAHQGDRMERLLVVREISSIPGNFMPRVKWRCLVAIANTVARVPDTITGIRSAIKTLLSDELGVFSNGTTAIHVTPPELPSGITCYGIQCIIRRFPRLMRSRAGGGSLQSVQQNYWDVVFRQFDREVVSVVTTADVAQGAESIDVTAIDSGLLIKAKIQFGDVVIRLSQTAQIGATALAIEPAPRAIASDMTGIHNPLKDLDSIVAKMRSRFPLMRERILETNEEGIYPQVSYLLNFSKIINYK